MVKYTFLLAHPKMTYTSPYEAEKVVSTDDDGIQRQVPVVANIPMMNDDDDDDDDGARWT